MIEQIAVTQLGSWLASASQDGQPALLLDVRESDELRIAALAEETVATSGGTLRHIPMSQLASRVGELDPTQAVACLCHHGGRSQRVALYLAQQGFEKIANIEGGIDAWAREIDPKIVRY
mgnify:CR=1 FL=1